jgi:hypothetical protein
MHLTNDTVCEVKYMAFCGDRDCLSIRLCVRPTKPYLKIFMGFGVGFDYRNLLSKHEFHENQLAVILTCAFHIS